jgi:hypothetical protein
MRQARKCLERFTRYPQATGVPLGLTHKTPFGGLGNGWAAIRSAGNDDRSCCCYRLSRNLDPYNLFRSASLSAQEPRGPRQPGFLSGVNATPVNMRTFGAPASEAASREITNERTDRVPDRVGRLVKSYTPFSSLLMRCLLWHVYTLQTTPASTSYKPPPVGPVSRDSDRSFGGRRGDYYRPEHDAVSERAGSARGSTSSVRDPPPHREASYDRSMSRLLDECD